MATTTQILRGLEIIEKYEPGCDVSTHFNKIWAGRENLLFKMTECEAKLMVENGWFICPLFHTWCHHT